MAKKGVKGKNEAKAARVWVAPRHSLKGPAGERAWEHRRGGLPTTSRYLELADIALGPKKAAPQHHKTPSATHESKSETEPYLG